MPKLVKSSVALLIEWDFWTDAISIYFSQTVLHMQISYLPSPPPDAMMNV